MNFILILLVFAFTWFCQLFVLKLKVDVGKKPLDNDLKDLNDNKIESKELTPQQEKTVFRIKSIFFWLAIIATFLCGIYVGKN
jgi:hypothetical protein